MQAQPPLYLRPSRLGATTDSVSHRIMPCGHQAGHYERLIGRLGLVWPERAQRTRRIKPV